MYPDPVRVISFGVPVEDLEANPEGDAGVETSVEFCGGTHLLRSGHMVDFVITSEEAIAKGIRRIVALTGPEAEKARKKTAFFESELNVLKTKVQSAGSDDAFMKEITKQLNEINIDIAQAVIPYVKKDELRNIVKDLKKAIMDRERAAQAAVANVIIDEAKKLCEQNPNAKFLVHRFNAHNNTRALDSALKYVQKSSADICALFLSIDEESKKIFCYAGASKSGIAKGLKANEWIQQLTTVMGGKGGGKPESAQATGANFDKVEEIMELAKQFAASKLE